jgi:hypothetical protein
MKSYPHKRLASRNQSLEDGETNSWLHVFLTLSLTLRLGGWVKVRTLSDTNTALTSAETIVVVVVGSGMEGGAVVPDCYLIH